MRVKYLLAFVVGHALLLSDFAACIASGELVGNGYLVQKPNRYAWTIRGQVRRRSMFFSWNVTLDRDQFRVVRSDGQRFVGALASQSSEQQPQGVYLYMIDASQGRLLYVVPSISSSVFCVGREYFVLVGNIASGKQAFEARRVSDGKVMLKGFVSDYLPVRASVVAIAGNTIRFIGTDSRLEAFLEVPSGVHLESDHVTRTIADLTMKGLIDKEDPWHLSPATGGFASTKPADSKSTGSQHSAGEVLRSYWENDPDYPKRTVCGNLLVEIPMDSRTRLVATKQ